ncbi:hypothetical protein [Variovorax atrisoli]|uniref:hypothetical protein n=1 Tax=Variovorax atrisoli TaxID=3394203 RepID=UPI0017AE1E7C|nr:hypothetical protein [Variovorax sp. BK613]MBB3639806.1 hypothetical protein [Variovorax sp. BK613]
MPRARTPLAKAKAAGAEIIHPERFRDRKGPKKPRAVGDPYVGMSDKEKKVWAEFRAELPWLTSSHRTLLRLACYWTAKLDEKEFGVSATQALSSILSKLGATPVDETKVNHGDDEDEDPADEFFN